MTVALSWLSAFLFLNRRKSMSQSVAVSSAKRRGKVSTQVSTDAQDVNVTHLALLVLPHPERQQLISEAAYHRAEARCFEPGHEVDDWLAAEAEVDARLYGERAA
jgi:hypothetical protein